MLFSHVICLRDLKYRVTFPPFLSSPLYVLVGLLVGLFFITTPLVEYLLSYYQSTTRNPIPELMLSRISVSLFRRSSARYSTIVEGTVCVRKGTTTTPPVAPRRAMTTTTALRAATTGQPQQQSGRRFASSHDDFAPQRAVVDDGEDEAITMIKQHVTDNPVMVYMKGTPSQPMCTLLVFVLLLLLFGVFVLFSIL